MNMGLKTSNSNKPFKCEYCGAGFAREKTLNVHLCEKKRRHLQRNERRVYYGFYAFNRFYRLSVGTKQDKTYEEFCNSTSYNAFVKFGSYISNVKPLYPEKYIDYVVTSGIKIDKWCDDSLYEKYALELIKKESVDTAIERTLKTMMDWAETNDSVWTHYFKYVSENRATWDIRDGKISPWVLLNSVTGKEMLGKLNDEQLKILYQVLDPAFWKYKFQKHKDDVEVVKELTREYNF